MSRVSFTQYLDFDIGLCLFATSGGAGIDIHIDFIAVCLFIGYEIIFMEFGTGRLWTENRADACSCSRSIAASMPAARARQ